MAQEPDRWVITAATVALATFAVLLLFGWGGPEVTMVVGVVGSLVASVFAMGCAVIAARRSTGRQRLAWSFFTGGLAGWVLANGASVYFNVFADGSPAAAAVFRLGYCLLPLSVCAAALFVPYGGLRPGIRKLLDGVIVAASLFVLSWHAVLHDLFASAATASPLFAVSAAYPVADVVMITISLMFVARAPGGLRLSPLMATSGLILIALSDGAALYFWAHGVGVHQFVVVGWAAGLYFIGLCGLTSRRIGGQIAQIPRPMSRVALWLPYAPVPLAVPLGTWDLFTDRNSPTLVAGLVLILAALIRQFVLLDENRQLLATVHEMALRDPLTGLANRALFADRLTHAMQLRLRNSSSVAVLIADLDDFKLVNDSLGHPVGDQMLRSVAERIQNAVRTGDTVARLGGDEFAILVEDTPETAHLIAESIVRTFDEPFLIDGREIHMRLSIGVATADDDEDSTVDDSTVSADDSTVSADELFKRADLAMYSAKRAHAGARAFTPAMRRDAVETPLSSRPGKPGGRVGVARIQLLGDLRRAIHDGRLDLLYQPKFSLTTGVAVGVEALVRWPHPELGMLQPADFLPLVRENGLMEDLTDLVLDQAIFDCAGWYAAGVQLPVAINLSAPSLADENLPERILSALAEHGMPSSSLAVEITEDLLLASVIRARAVLERLRGAGIRVAIDDFGSGYATMTYLHELPIDELKLDRQFVAPILHDERAAAIVRSVIALAGVFGLAVVAEGVEDLGTAEKLREYGCGFAQGHYFSPAVPADAIRLGTYRRDVQPSAITPAGAVGPSSA